VADVAVPPQGEGQASTELQAGSPDDGRQRLEGASPPPGDGEGVRSPGPVDAATAGSGRPRLSRRLRRFIWAALGSLLLFAAFQGLQWRWRRAWMWVEHPHLIRPRTIPNAFEAGMTALTVFKWVQGLLAPLGQSSRGAGQGPVSSRASQRTAA
jgi:hypothetical protein